MLTLTDPLSLTLPSLNEWRESVRQDERRELYSRDPYKWVQDKLGEHLWSKQREMFNSIRDNRRTAVYSCHRVGKSHLGGRIAFWWLDTHIAGEALVVTSAHSSTQVKMALWREMSRVHAKGSFPGRMNQTEYWMPIGDKGREEMVAFGRKPADDDHSAFQGTYAKFVLFILDEACYVPPPLWDGADTLIGNEFSRIVAFGNPDDPNTEFGSVCKPGSGWNAISIGYMDTPNFSGEECPQNVKDLLIGPTWVAEKKKKWGENNPFYISKVLGKFPEVSAVNSLIPAIWVRAAQERTLEPSVPIELGIDVGGGSNRNVIALRRGPVVRVIHRDQNPDTMQTLSNTLQAIKDTGATSAKIDDIGIGHGAADRAKEMANDQRIKQETPDLAKRASLVSGVSVGDPAEDNESYVNLRAEGYWGLRERFEEGSIDIDPEDEDLAAQLVALRYKRSSGRLQIESKEDMRRRGVESPDDADGVMLAFLPDQEREISVSVTWDANRTKSRGR